MAGFCTKTFMVEDDYMTPKEAWANIIDYIPKDKTIWEPFYGDSNSGKYLRELGYNVIHENEDFFEHNKGDIIVSNPPFSKYKEILIRLLKIDKPFILILPISKLCTNTIRTHFTNDHKLQLIIPRRRIQFSKNGSQKNKCNFDCAYYCFKMNLERDITWLLF